MAKKRSSAGNNSTTSINKKIKKHEDDQNYENDMAEDTYTFQLPDVVIYQILLLLPIKVAAQASLLSKQWTRVWSTVSISELDMDEDAHSSGGDGNLDRHRRRRKFLKFLNWCLKRVEKNKHLDKFRLRMRYLGCAKSMDNWLSFAVERNVKELDMSIGNIKEVRRCYYLSHTVLNAKSLTILSLENVSIQQYCTGPVSCLPSLKTMSLKCVGLSPLTFSHLISGCPSLESLSLTSLTQCHSSSDLLMDLKVSSLTLKSFEIIKMPFVQVEAMNLESFRFIGESRNHILRDQVFNGNATCGTLKNLELFSACLLGPWFEDLDSRFPFLENLVLHKCHNFNDHINIFSQHLKHIVLCGINLYTTTINTPNLLSFRLDGYSLPSAFSIYAPNLSQATIILSDNVKQVFSNSHYTTRQFLRNFDGSSKISLSVNHAEVIIFPQEMRTCAPPLPNLKHLNIEINSPIEVNDSALRDSLRWMAPSLEILSIKLNSLDRDSL